MSATPCPTCTDLLQKLSGASERLFVVSSELSSMTMAWRDDMGGPPDQRLVLQAQALRAECTLIRTVLQDHRVRWHWEDAS